MLKSEYGHTIEEKMLIKFINAINISVLIRQSQEGKNTD
jgi:hypothetical protein